jgi:hypothetical protein
LIDRAWLRPAELTTLKLPGRPGDGVADATVAGVAVLAKPVHNDRQVRISWVGALGVHAAATHATRLTVARLTADVCVEWW